MKQHELNSPFGKSQEKELVGVTQVVLALIPVEE